SRPHRRSHRRQRTTGPCHSPPRHQVLWPRQS
ncbi:hypothetical protein BN1708_018988, partial [Verticillium longisporum]